MVEEKNGADDGGEEGGTRGVDAREAERETNTAKVSTNNNTHIQ